MHGYNLTDPRLHRKNVVYLVITESYTCSIYTFVPKTAEAMFYYQCTIIIFIAATKNHKIQTLSKSSSIMMHRI